MQNLRSRSCSQNTDKIPFDFRFHCDIPNFLLNAGEDVLETIYLNKERSNSPDILHPNSVAI